MDNLHQKRVAEFMQKIKIKSSLSKDKLEIA